MKCRVTSCGHARSTSWSLFCATHRKRHRKLGHPEQQRLLEGEFKHYEQIVRSYLARGAPGRALIEHLKQRWLTLGDEHISKRAQGRPTIGWHPKALVERNCIAETADLEQVTLRLLAAYVLKEDRPHFFRDDRSFVVLLQRTIRKSVAGSFEQAWHKGRQHEQRRYREIPLQAAVLLGRWMNDAFGAPATLFAQECVRQVNQRLASNQEATKLLLELRDAQPAASP